MTTQSGASWGASPPGRGIWGANTDIATCGLICTLRYFYRFMVYANLISSPSQSNHMGLTVWSHRDESTPNARTAAVRAGRRNRREPQTIYFAPNVNGRMGYVWSTRIVAMVQ